MAHKRKLRFKTIFLSDVHLGIPECKAAQVSHFLRNSLCEKLVLNGDIIDAWALARDGKWTKAHTHFVRTVLRKMEKENVEVIYTRGNHDDVLERFLPISLDNL
ncbi:MAG: UDP-2,3-diacylglucosamine diphosphatase, partial [Roseimicrobium sp.]